MSRPCLHLALALLLSGAVLPGTSVSASQAPSRTDTARAAKPAPTAKTAPTAKPAKAARKSGKAKGAKKTALPCDEPTRQADVRKVPVPVPADPLAPAVAPCPGTTP